VLDAWKSAHGVRHENSERLADAGIEPSVGRVGDSYDRESVDAVRRT
jgi:transposase InsO family protein